MEIKAVGDVICDSGQLGNGGMFLRNPNFAWGKRCCRLTKDVSRTAIMRSNNFPSALRKPICL